MGDVIDSTHRWTEDSSAQFIEQADMFVPARAEQIATLLGLMPARQDEVFQVVELGAGAGVLARAVLERFPACRYLALDGSERMREQMRQSLAAFSDRLEIRPFELADHAWRETLPESLRYVLSSLCIHHLPGEHKRQLFADLAARTEPGGALLIADIVEPATPEIARLYARQYDEIVQAQSRSAYGDLRGFVRFQEQKWNYFAYDYGVPDSGDYPSLLSEQLFWLRDAGFGLVDCFWLRAGHAVFGAYK
jgi:tRNA (cmo5U34)-methyltransferase